MVSFHFSRHVLEELEKRKIAQELVKQVLEGPQQKVPELDDITCFQSQVEIDGKSYLLRVLVNENVNPPMVITAYRTSKIHKYWREA